MHEKAHRETTQATISCCEVCGRFVTSRAARCVACARHPNHLAGIAPVALAIRGSAIYRDIRAYKNHFDPRSRVAAGVHLFSLLWRYLEAYESEVADRAGCTRFDLVTAVPSGDAWRDEERVDLRSLVASCGPLAGRYARLLRATGRGRCDRAYDSARYEPDSRVVSELSGRRVLLIDDLWVTGAHAQSAAYALLQAGATRVALVVLGLYVRLDWPVAPGVTYADCLAATPTGA
jgi:hypothetical protein